MRLCLGALLTAAWLLTGHAPVRYTSARAAGQPAIEAQSAFLKRNCLGCHSQAQKQRGTVPVAFDSLDLGSVSADAKTWERVVRKMRAGLRPPAGVPRPDRASHEAFLTWLEGELDRGARLNPNPGRTEPLHRLNRTEYQNAVRDLLGLGVDVVITNRPAAVRQIVDARETSRTV